MDSEIDNLEDDAGHNYAGLAEAFQIFSKYDKGQYQIGARKSLIYVWLNPNRLDEADKARLLALNWEELHIEDDGLKVHGYQKAV